MKLAEHVQHIKDVTYNSFDNLFARLGIRAKELAGEDLIPDNQLSKRAKILELIDNHKEEKDDYSDARERALEELTFTLFNRIAAVKVMEAKTLFPEIITKRPENGDRSFQHKAWLEQNPGMRSEELEGLREFIKHAFNNLGEELALYHKSYPYALLPNTIDLNEIIESFNAVEKDKNIDHRIWASDDILGWLYESYNNDKKQAFKEDEGKTEYDKVSLQSQWYTPRWVVKFLVNNSLGKLYLEMYPTSDIQNQKKIVNAPKKRIREPKSLHEITLIDPALGSGNFLLYAFDLLYELYIDQIEFFGADYDEENIPKLIIEHNLFGIDLDDRAVQLAQLGLYIKAKSKNRNISVPGFNVVSSDFYLPDFETVRPLFEDGSVLKSGVTDLLKEIWDDLQNAHKFGSLLKIEDRVNRRLRKFKGDSMDLFVQEEAAKYGRFKEKFFPRIRKAVQKHANGNTTAFVKEKTLDALKYLQIITQQYNIVVTNPPFLDSRDYGDSLRDFLDQNYRRPKSFYKNLYASFVKRCTELLARSGSKLGIIHPRTFMFISSFSDARDLILDNFHINGFVDFGLSSMFGSVMVDPCFYVLEENDFDHKGIFIGLDKYTRTPLEKHKKEFLNNAIENEISGLDDEHLFKVEQNKFKSIETSPFIFWISSSFREKFGSDTFGDKFDICNGISSGGNNEQFFRYWWEISNFETNNYEKINDKWAFINKGGGFKKWYGNIWLVFEWGKNGEKLKKLKEDYPSIRYSNEDKYFKEGLAFAGSSTKGLSVRYQPPNCLFERSGKSIFYEENGGNYNYPLALLNSKISTFMVDCLNPTVSFQSGDIERIPYYESSDSELNSRIENLTNQNVSIEKLLCKYSLVEPLFESHDTCLINSVEETNTSLNNIVHTFLSFINRMKTIVLLNEALINKLLFDVYDLSKEDKLQVLENEDKSIGDLPVISEAVSSFKDAIKDSDYVTEELWEKLDQIEQNEQIVEKKDELEKEFPKLYQKNYGFEEFCIKNEINPINAWYWFRESGIIPQQRVHDIALEFLADLIREILMEDEDGMIPLVRNAGEEILIDRLERKMREKGFTTAQISQLDGLLGRPLNEYLEEHFFEELSDHLNLFMYLPKTPFIWHLSSGPHKGFECYLVIYKWNRDNLLSLKSVYIEKRERALKNRLTDLGDRSDAASQNERDTIQKQLEEIEEFKEKIDALIASGYDPILDDGVGKNIAPLQKRGLIPYDVLTNSQLKKYLNADW